ncbi:MAG: hypothetical protein RL068_885, partial [Actinomycetota bacterium]
NWAKNEVLDNEICQFVLQIALLQLSQRLAS